MAITFTDENGLELLDNTSNPDEAVNFNSSRLDAGRHFKKTAGENIDKGEWVVWDGAGDAVLAQADSVSNAMVQGIWIEDTGTGDDNYARYEGTISKTSWGLTPSTQYYLDPTTPGAMTITRPTTPNITVELGESDETGDKFYIRIRIYNTIVLGGDHSTLGNLTWSTAGHTMDATLVMNNNSITGITDLTLNGVGSLSSPTSVTVSAGATQTNWNGTTLDVQIKTNTATAYTIKDNAGSPVSFITLDSTTGSPIINMFQDVDFKNNNIICSNNFTIIVGGVSAIDIDGSGTVYRGTTHDFKGDIVMSGNDIIVPTNTADAFTIKDSVGVNFITLDSTTATPNIQLLQEVGINRAPASANYVLDVYRNSSHTYLNVETGTGNQAALRLANSEGNALIIADGNTLTLNQNGRNFVLSGGNVTFTATNANFKMISGAVEVKFQAQTSGATRGVAGTESSHEFDLITNNVPRLIISNVGAFTYQAAYVHDFAVGTLANVAQINNGGNGIAIPSDQVTITDSVAGAGFVLSVVNTNPTGVFKGIADYTVPNLAVGSNAFITFGKNSGTRNRGFLNFNYAGSGNTDNYAEMGLTGMTPIFVIHGTGRVGIGTISPGEKLEVDGNVIITGNLDMTTGTISNLASMNNGGNVVVCTDRFQTDSGRIVNTTRIDSGDSPYAVLSSDHHIKANTDTAAVTVNLPAGVAGTAYRIVNTGTSATDVTVNPNGAEKLVGANSSFILRDGEALIVTFDSTDGWD